MDDAHAVFNRISVKGAGGGAADGGEIDALVAQLARGQYGVVSLGQLQAAGLTYRQVQTRVKQGRLHRLHRGVFAVGHTRIIDHAHLIAALLATGQRSFLSHRTAAAVWELRALSVRHLEVTIIGTSTRQRPGLVVHGTIRPPGPDEVVSRNGLRVSSVARLLVELAERERETELERLVTQAVRKRRLKLDQLEEVLARHRRRAGIEKLKRVLAGYRPRPDRGSRLEAAFDKLLEPHPEIPQPQRNVIIDGWEIDFYWPDQRVAVELDGRPYHVAVRDLEKDRYKDAKLLGLGIRPLRITDWRMESDPSGALADVRTILGIAPRRSSG